MTAASGQLCVHPLMRKTAGEGTEPNPGTSSEGGWAVWKSCVWKETRPDLINSACSPFQTCTFVKTTCPEQDELKPTYRGRDLHDRLPVLNDEPELWERAREDHGRRPDTAANVDNHRVLREIPPRECCSNINKGLCTEWKAAGLETWIVTHSQ